MSTERWIELWHGDDGRWHWRTVSGRGNLPDTVVKGASRGYAWRRGALRAAKRENPGVGDIRAAALAMGERS